MDKSASVKILNAGGRAVGNGFLTEGRVIVTCAHVLRDALGLDAVIIEEIEAQCVTVEFHWLKDQPRITSLVEPGSIRYDTSGRDFALLRPETLPIGVHGLRLANATMRRFDAELHPFFPTLDSSIPIIGMINGQDEHGRLILTAKDHFSQFIEPGNSGAPVFMANGELVAGIVSTVDTKVRQAFLQPANMVAESHYELATNTSSVRMSTSVNTTQETMKAPSKDTESAAKPESKNVTVLGLADDATNADPNVSSLAIEALKKHGLSGLKATLRVAYEKKGNCDTVGLHQLTRSLGSLAIPFLIEKLDGPAGGLAAPCFSAFALDQLADRALLNRFENSNYFSVRKDTIIAMGYAGLASQMSGRIREICLSASQSDVGTQGNLSDYRFQMAALGFSTISNAFGKRPYFDALEHINELMAVLLSQRGWIGLASCFPSIAPFSPESCELAAQTWHSVGKDERLLLIHLLGRSNSSRHAWLLANAHFTDDSQQVRYTAGQYLITMGGPAEAAAVRHNLELSEPQAEQGYTILSLWHWRDDWPNYLEEDLVTSYQNLKTTERPRAAISLAIAGNNTARFLAERSFVEATNDGDRDLSALAVVLADRHSALDLIDDSHAGAKYLERKIYRLAAQILAGRFELVASLYEALAGNPNWSNSEDRLLVAIVLCAIKVSEPEKNKFEKWSAKLWGEGNSSGRWIDHLSPRLA